MSKPAGNVCQLTARIPVQFIRTVSAPDAHLPRVELLARSSVPFYHYGFDAYVVHDFQTMRHREQIAIDWEHDEIIGKSQAISVQADGLHIIAELTLHNEQSKEVAAMLQAGVPLEASISFRDFDVAYYTQGQRPVINGAPVEAPDDGDLCVINNWYLSSCAICKEGYDPNTEADMLSFLKRRQALTAPAPETAQKLSTEETAVEELSEEVAPDVPSAPEPEEEPEEKPEVPEVNEDAPETLTIGKAEMAQFVAAFGAEKAIEYIASGLTLSAAKEKEYDFMRERLAAMEAENQRLKAKQETPVPFCPTETAPVISRINGLTYTQSKLCTLIARN